MLLNRLGDVFTAHWSLISRIWPIFFKSNLLQFIVIYCCQISKLLHLTVQSCITNQLSDEGLCIALNDIADAISELDNDSAPGPYGVPATILKNCAHEISKPLRIIWSESLTSGIVPAFYKTSCCCKLPPRFTNFSLYHNF